MLIISDYKYYADHTEEIDEWCQETFGYYPRTGMIITFKDEQHLSWFLARWS
jgi:hypothetical protein